MMMRCLNAGGIPAIRDTARDRLIEVTSDETYQLNPESLYETSPQVSVELRYHPERFHGKLIKTMNRNVVWLAPAEYRIVFMLRNWEEVRQSHNAGLGNLPALRDEEEYENKMELTVGILEQRRDIAVTALQYRGVIADPLGTFERLRDLGWPIDSEKAAAEVDPSLCRFKVENLTAGVLCSNAQRSEHGGPRRLRYLNPTGFNSTAMSI